MILTLEESLEATLDSYFSPDMAENDSTPIRDAFEHYNWEYYYNGSLVLTKRDVIEIIRYIKDLKKEHQLEIESMKSTLENFKNNERYYLDKTHAMYTEISDLKCRTAISREEYDEYMQKKIKERRATCLEGDLSFADKVQIIKDSLDELEEEYDDR